MAFDRTFLRPLRRLQQPFKLLDAKSDNNNDLSKRREREREREREAEIGDRLTTTMRRDAPCKSTTRVCVKASRATRAVSPVIYILNVCEQKSVVTHGAKRTYTYACTYGGGERRNERYFHVAIVARARAGSPFSCLRLISFIYAADEANEIHRPRSMKPFSISPTAPPCGTV